MSGALDPFSVDFSVDFGVGATTDGWVSLPITALRSITIGGLTSGSTYQFRVLAINAEGSGPPSPVLTVKI